MARARLRDLGIEIGVFPTGPNNAITDVKDVLVGQTTLIYDTPRVARTGVTLVVPRAGEIWTDFACAGYFSLNGNGEMTGIPWMEEAGMLVSPIGITNTHQVGVVRDALVAYAGDHGMEGWLLPVVAETHDGWLNDAWAFHVTKEHVYQAMKSAKGGHVPEGNVGGGTGMTLHGFKGGTGTSSRVVQASGGTYTVGALVQANYGDRAALRVDGVPVGREIGPDKVPLARTPPPPRTGSIIVVIGTDAPLVPVQCKRLARRAAVGIARVGGTGHNGSGDIFVAFATGNHVPIHTRDLVDMKMVHPAEMDQLIDGAAEAVEEAVLNALVGAETMTGQQGRTVHAIPHDELQRVMAAYRPRR